MPTKLLTLNPPIGSLITDRTLYLCHPERSEA